MNDIIFFEGKLTVVIPTYNRVKYLQHTLEQFVNTPFAQCKIVVQDNNSLDNTAQMIEQFSKNFPNLVYCKNKYNIGANANILRAIENSDTEYTWVIGDDDIYDFNNCEDVISKINSSIYNLIQVGGHKEHPWIGGFEKTPDDLKRINYRYFKFSSFIGSSIFKTDFFTKRIIKAYNNIVNGYPHMPYIFDIYLENQYIYVSKNRLVTPANYDKASYTVYQLFGWWLETSLLLPTKRDQRKCFLEQYDSCKPYSVGIYVSSWMKKKITNEHFFKALSLFNIFQIISIFSYSIFRFVKLRIKKR